MPLNHPMQTFMTTCFALKFEGVISGVHLAIANDKVALLAKEQRTHPNMLRYWYMLIVSCQTQDDAGLLFCKMYFKKILLCFVILYI